MQKIIFGALCLSAAITASLAQAQALNPSQVRSLAASCAACHGTNGQAQAGMVPLAGQPALVIAQKMQDFKAGRVPTATIMHQLAKGYNDDEITAIAAFFAAPKK